MPCRGIRGAVVAEANTAAAVRNAARDLLEAIVAANGVRPEDVASVFFTASPDITADYPALAAREMGWLDTALLCAQEIAVPNGLGRCIRVLVHWNTDKKPEEITHCYLGAAASLRPDRHGPATPSATKGAQRSVKRKR